MKKINLLLTVITVCIFFTLCNISVLAVSGGGSGSGGVSGGVNSGSGVTPSIPAGGGSGGGGGVTATPSGGTDGIWQYKISNNEVTIVSCDKDASGEVVIPETIENYPVTSIGERAFYSCSSLTSITIPNSVTSIGKNAFLYCSSLANINVDVNNNYYCSESGVLYNKTQTEIIWYPAGKASTNFVIPNSVTSICDGAFRNCDDLTSVTIPNGVTSVGDKAFCYCSSLTSITISASVTSIGDNAFEGCQNLESLYITDLAAYLNCKYGNGSNPMLYAKKLYINGKRAIKVTVPDNVSKIPDYAFNNCDSIASITIPSSVTSIGNHAFEGCSGLKSITIPDGVTSIGTGTFYNCRDLTSIIIPNSVTSIGYEAFYRCSSLTSITIPNSITNIGDSAFGNCSGLTNITIPDSVTKIGSSAFYGCDSLTSIMIPDSVTSIGGSAFGDCSSLTSVTIPDSITSIGKNAFSGCRSLTDVTIPDGVTSIGNRAFYYCYNLKRITLPKSVTEIEAYTFSGCPISLVFYKGTSEEWDEMYIGSDNGTLSTATIVYNAAKKTYKFVTNCESVLPDITDYAVMSSPAVENSGKTLLGWYDNEGLTGDPVTFPYYGDATTLYAAWTDRTGTSFDDAFDADANQEYTVTATDSEQMIYYEFTPKLTGEYRFYTKGNIDTYGYLYDSEKRRLTSNDDGGENNNFKIVYNLTAGEKYYIAMKCYGGAGTFTFVTETDCFEGTKTVCVTAAGGESIFVTVPKYLPQNARIILACYEKGKLTEMLSSSNKDETIYFVVSEKFDSAKVMVWENIRDMTPVCGVEIVK